MTTHETQHETTEATPNPGTEAHHGLPHDSQLGESLIGLGKLGQLWAAHGIRMGVAALQTSAITLTQVASTLATLADGLKGRQETAEDDEHPRV